MDKDQVLNEAEAPAEPSKFSSVVEAFDRGDRNTALGLLRDVDVLDADDVALLCDLLDDDKSYASIHPYRLELMSRTGKGKPAKPFFVRVEEDKSIADEIHKFLAQGTNLKAALYAVHLERNLEITTVQKAWQRAGKFGKKSPFMKKPKHTK